MKHSTYFYMPPGQQPIADSVVWKRPIAWNAAGKPTHFQSHKAFISFKTIINEDNMIIGGRLTMRKCSLEVEPPTFS